jgi:hypothetical protein
MDDDGLLRAVVGRIGIAFRVVEL